jgi:hypothetical protein
VNERKPSFEERLRSGEGAVSLINEPIVDYGVDFTVSALAIARQRWRHAELIEQLDER